MYRDIKTRVNDIADYIITTKNTIRKTAQVFNVSKSTVHKDLKDRLYKINVDKYQKIQTIMLNHLATRHLKGGESTRKIFLRKKGITV